MPESPRNRRLKTDLLALERLASDSTIFTFTPYGTPPDFYVLRFRGRGLWQAHPSAEILIRAEHEVHVRLGAQYPRLMPDLAWKSPVFHPNISHNGVVCLGGYGTFWVPSLSLCDLCGMLWDMLRYANFDEKSAYNREAAAWAKHQNLFPLPIDDRPLRDKLVSPSLSPVSVPERPAAVAATQFASPIQRQDTPHRSPRPEVAFVGEVVEAQLVAARQPDILFIE